MNMPNVTIKGDPRMGAAIAEGAATVELRAVKAEYAKLQAVDAVRREGDDRRWERTRRRLARKYSIKPVGRARGAILGVWALIWLTLIGMADYLTAWNRGR
jgi:hypothetical protein